MISYTHRGVSLMKLDTEFIIGHKFNAKLQGFPEQLRNFNINLFLLWNPRVRHRHYKIPALDSFPTQFKPGHLFRPSAERPSNYSVFRMLLSWLFVRVVYLMQSVLWFYCLSNNGIICLLLEKCNKSLQFVVYAYLNSPPLQLPKI